MPENPEPKTYPLKQAVAIAEKFLEFLNPHCARVQVVGSIRRRKPFVKDIELLIVSKPGVDVDPSDLFGNQIDRPKADKAIEDLEQRGIITRRKNKAGHFTWGAENKLATHVKSGMPIDFFFTDEKRWWNALVVRTGPTKSNKAIAAAAIARGWHWHAYGDGFTRGDGKSSMDRFTVKEERDAFNHVGLPYLPPEKR